MSIADWIDGTCRAGSARGSASCSTSPTTSSTAPSPRAELAQPALPPRLPGPGSFRDLRPVEREVPRARRQRPDLDAARARCAGRSRLGSALVGDPPAQRGAYALTFRHGRAARTVTRRPCGARAAVLDPPQPSTLAAGFCRCKLTRDREQGMGTNSKLNVQFTDRHWEGARLQRRDLLPTPATRARGRSRAPSPGRSGILVDYTGGNRRELRERDADSSGRSSSSRRSSRSCRDLSAR